MQLRGAIESASIEQRYDEGDDGALIMGRQIGGATQPGQVARGAWGREVIADRRHHAY